MRGSRLVVGLVLALACGTAAADWVDAPNKTGGGWVARSARSRHQGVFLHLELGAGGLRSRTSDSGSYDYTMKGFGGSFALAAGASVTETIVIGGELWDVVALSPKLEAAGASESTDSGSTLALVGFGPMFRFYFDPGGANFFASITPSLTRLTAKLEQQDGSNIDGSTKIGFGARLALGKEWMIPNSKWGLGIAAHLALASNKDQGDGAPTWRTVGGGLAFSATWN